MDMAKSDSIAFDEGVVGLQKGEEHLQELEVDVGTVLQEEGEFDFESDQSPFPEGAILDLHSRYQCISVTDCGSTCRDTKR